LKKNNSFLDTYKNLKVIVTGTTGFKGAWLAEWLLKLGSKVVGVGLRPEKDAIIFRSLKLDKKIKQYFIDINNFGKINGIIKKEKPDIIFHLAAQSIVSLSYKKPLETFRTNVIGSSNVLESVRKNKIPYLVYITSDKCYLNLDKESSYKETDTLGGLDNYSSSKAAAELIFSSYFHSYLKNKKHLSAVTARAGNVIGGGDFKKDRIVPDIIKSVIKQKKIILRSPQSTRPWQHVLEPLSGYLTLGHKLIEKKLKSDLIPSWNFGPHKKNCKTVNFITQLILNKWEGNNQKILYKKNRNFHESKLLSLSIKKAKKELKWEPRLTLNETVKLTVDWYKNYFFDDEVEKITNYHIEYYCDK